MEKLKNIFDIQYGNQFDFSKMDVSENDSGTNFISRSSQNNGFVAKVERYKDIEPFEAGLITVTMGGSYLLASFVQPAPFYTAQNIKVLKPKTNLTIEEKLFYCSAIEHNRFRYHSHSREANTTFDDILVPSLDELPKYVQKKRNYDMFLQKPFLDKKPEINVNNWEWFRYDEIFEIYTSSDKNYLESENGNIPYISSTQFNNGVSSFVQSETTQNENTITVARNGSVGSAFYHSYNYCASPDDVRIFNPKFEMNQYTALFLCTLIEKEKYRFTYGRKFGTKRMQKTKIKLPITKDGTPDWQFMEIYIKSLPYSKSI